MLSDLNQDFQDLIKSLTDQNVEFLVVGAHALAFHGVARFTEDLDLWMRRSKSNTLRLQRALADFGIRISDTDTAQLLEERKFLRFGHPPTKIEILNFLDGCEFDTAAARAPKETLGQVEVAILSLEDYVATKQASGRPKDASDLALLRSMIGDLPGDEPRLPK
jgi:hypothetical protein